MSRRKLQAIASGFKNYIFPNATIEELANVRAKICSKCPDMKSSMKFKVLDLIKALSQNSEKVETKEIIKGAGCGICKCYLPAKVRQTLESCPLDKW